jgi:4-hydroxy-tetrahydrodipicolinate reductase
MLDGDWSSDVCSSDLGTVAGDHTVHFLADNERLSLSHLAENRAIFARGAVRAAEWLIGRGAGRYTMPEVLGL